MGKRRSHMLQKVSNLIKISIFITKMKLIYLKKSTKFSNGFLQERQFSPSTTPLIRFRRRKTNGGSVYSICFLSCFGERHHGVVVDENYSYDYSAIVEVEKDGEELLYAEEEDNNDENSVDERAERFIERFYEEIKRQKRELSANLHLNRMLEY